jgi:hypothetical protein
MESVLLKYDNVFLVNLSQHFEASQFLHLQGQEALEF